MLHLRLSFFAILTAASLALLSLTPSHAQGPFPFETDLVATRRVFVSSGPGFRAIHRGPGGTYYILTAPAAAVQIYDRAGKRVGQIPSDAANGTALQFGESFDVDREGRVAVSDRGANAIKIYSANGMLSATLPITGPAPVALLGGDEIAVASPNERRLVVTYDLAGKFVRETGRPEEIADSRDINHQANLGHLATDDMGNTYFAFDYLPEPTVRKFDRAGYLSMEISLTTLEFQPAAQAARRALTRTERGVPALHRIITAIGIDPQTQDVWIAIGTLLMKFDKDGMHVASYRTYMPGGARLEAESILVEPDRLLIGADPAGIFEFPRLDKRPQ